MNIGLTLGKYAPLHCGHQQIIELALAEMDHVIVLIYDMPEMDIPPLPIRANWIRDLYPQVEVLEAWDGPTETGLEPAVTAKHDAYLLRRLSGKAITHFYSAEPYGEHVSRALRAVDRRVEKRRMGQSGEMSSTIPVSGTALRENPYRYRQFIHPRVYRDLIVKVVLLGAPSTGKTTLARELAQRYDTVWMPEYGREYWELHQQDRRLSQEQLLEIAIGHREREDQLLLEANRIMFVDTDASTTLQFSYYYHDAADQRLIELARQCRDRYDLVLLCDTDIPFDDTWDRSGEVSRTTMQRRIEADLIASKRPFHRISGTVEQRIQKFAGTQLSGFLRPR